MAGNLKATIASPTLAAATFLNTDNSGKALVTLNKFGQENGLTAWSNGWVGIGLGGVAPTQVLDVSGNARASGDVIGGTRLCIAADCRSA